MTGPLAMLGKQESLLPQPNLCEIAQDAFYSEEGEGGGINCKP